MGLFSSEDKYVAKLEDEIAYLRNQVSKLQECLYAQTSPEAYRQIKLDEQNLVVDPNLAEAQKRMREERNFYSDLAVEQERPLFESIEELESALAQVTRGGSLGIGPTDPSNSES
jgi:hypothetical protein